MLNMFPKPEFCTSAVTRRRILKGAIPIFSLAVPRAFASDPAPIADLHSHFGMISRGIPASGLADEMRKNRAHLVAWTFASDIRWIRSTENGVIQASEPRPGEVSEYFFTRLDRMVAYAAKSGLKTIATPKDVDACAAGQPSIVLAAEGADFLEGQIAHLDTAYQKGLRQLQLVHYIRNPFGDFQTVRPEFNGLTLAGKQLVEACSAKGILIDLAHSTGSSIDQALDVTKAPMIWSHGWVGESEGRWQEPYGYLQRRLSMSHAKKLAARGGVVALWGLGLQSPAPSWSAGKGSWTAGRGDQRGYARELASLVEQLGVDNVAIGTDMEGVGPDSSVSTYGDVRSVLEHLQEFKLSSGDIEKVAFSNYARVLRSVLLT